MGTHNTVHITSCFTVNILLHYQDSASPQDKHYTRRLSEQFSVGPLQVLDSCQKQEASRSPGAGRFSCSTSDVLSCIMHVISKGCVRRNEENPHIVEFLPEDPSTPQKGQAQFSFSRTEMRKDARDSVADIRCERDL